MAKSSAGQPKEMYLLALVELFQRFALWGVGYLLVLYLTRELGFSRKSATELSGTFSGLAFFIPLFGGYLADRIKYKIPVIGGCLATATGCFLIATGKPILLYPALLLTALGSGIFTPGIYATLGLIYRGDEKKSQSGFSIYYAAVNIGVFLAMIVLGALEQRNMWHTVFIVAGTVQLLAIIPFMMVMNSPKLKLPPLPKTLPPKEEALKSKSERSRIILILIISLILMIFWIGYSQSSTSLQLFAENFTNRTLFGFTLPSPWFVALESISLIVLAYPLAYIYRLFDKKKMSLSFASKAALSFFFIGISFLIMLLATLHLKQGSPHALISPTPLFSFYFILAISEMLIAPISLSLVATLSPERFRALLIGVWYVCTASAFTIGGFIAPLMNELSFQAFFALFVISAWITSLLLLAGKKKLVAMTGLHTTQT